MKQSGTWFDTAMKEDLPAMNPKSDEDSKNNVNT